MTMGSQPAYTLERDRRQRGFIGGVISLPGVSLPCLGAALDQVGGLEYCLYRRIDNLEIDRNRLSLERFEHVNVLGHCIVSQCWRDQSWSTEEGTRACCGGYDWGEDLFCYLETYEGCNMYGSYSVTEDPSIILFDVADDSFDLRVSRCCDKLHEALDLAKGVSAGLRLV